MARWLPAGHIYTHQCRFLCLAGHTHMPRFPALRLAGHMHMAHSPLPVPAGCMRKTLRLVPSRFQMQIPARLCRMLTGILLHGFPMLTGILSHCHRIWLTIPSHRFRMPAAVLSRQTARWKHPAAVRCPFCLLPVLPPDFCLPRLQSPHF